MAPWSPDGRHILFVRGSNSWFSSDAAREIFVMGSDGQEVKNLTKNNVRDDHPSWSEDGTTIYFVSDRDGSTNFYAMDADGANARKIADGSIVNEPEVSPDGNHLAYTKEVDGHMGLYVFDLRNRTERLLVGGQN